MSVTGQDTSGGNAVSSNMTAWALALARQDTGESLEKLKEMTDERVLGEKVYNSIRTLPKTFEEQPELVKDNAKHGATQAGYSSVGLIGDVAGAIPYAFSWGINHISRATVNQNIIPKWKDGLFSCSEGMRNKVKIAPDIERYIEDENGVMVKNPYADALWFTRSGSGFAVDAVTFAVTSGASGVAIGVGKGVLKPLSTVRSFKYGREFDRIGDAIEILQKAGRVKNAKKAEKLFNTADDMLEGKKYRTIYDRGLQKVFQGSRGPVNEAEHLERYAAHKFGRGYLARKIRRLEKKVADMGYDATESAVKKLDKAVDKLQNKLDDTINRVVERQGGTPFTSRQVLKIADDMPVENLGYGAAIGHSTKYGLYKGMRIADPLDHFRIQLAVGVGLMGWDYRLFKKEAEEKMEVGEQLYKHFKDDQSKRASMDIVNQFGAADPLHGKPAFSVGLLSTFTNRVNGTSTYADPDNMRVAPPSSDTRQTLDNTLKP